MRKYNNKVTTKSDPRYVNTVFKENEEHSQSFVTPNIIEGQNGKRYEILSNITFTDAQTLQNQTGFVIAFPPGKDNMPFIGNSGFFAQLRLLRDLDTGQFYGGKETIIMPDKMKQSLEEAPIQRTLTGLPHLMPLIDYAVITDPNDNQNPPLAVYIVMPLAALGNGEELSQHLKKFDAVSKEQILLAIAHDILTGFLGMHQKNIVHLDFRSANFVVDEKGAGIVIDFNCAQWLDETALINGNAQGNSDYFSSDRLEANAKEHRKFLGKPADLWSIGVTLLEVAVGKLTDEEFLQPKQHAFLKNAKKDSYASLILALIHSNPNERLTPEQALQQPILQQEIPADIRGYLREFVQSQQSKLRTKTTATLLAGNPIQLPLAHFVSYVNRPLLEDPLRALLLGKVDYAKQLGITAIHGSGGMGKSQLAVYLIHDPAVQQTFSRIFWFCAADSENSLLLQMKMLAQSIGLINNEIPPLQAKLILLGWLEEQFKLTEKPVLLVFDNADNPILLNDFFPKSGVHVFATSRSPQWPQGVAMDKMTVEQVVELFKRLFPGKTIPEKDIKDLWEVLDGLPLAIKLVAAHMRQEQIFIKEFLAVFQKKKQELLTTRAPLFGKELPHSIVTLYQVQLTRLQQEFPQALKLLQCSAFLAADDIPEFLLEALLGKEFSKERYEQAKKVLVDYGIWQCKAELETINLHRLTQDVVREQISSETKVVCYQMLISQLEYWFSGDYTALSITGKKLLLHQQRLKVLIEEEKTSHLIKPIDMANLLSQIGISYVIYFSKFAEAKPILNQALIIFKQELKQDYVKHFFKMNREYLLKLAAVTGTLSLTSIGAEKIVYSKLKKELKQGYYIFKKYLGPDNPYTALPLAVLGFLYLELGHFEKAQTYFNDSLKIFSKDKDTLPPYACLPLCGLGIAYRWSGKLSEATQALLEALALSPFIGFNYLINSNWGLTLAGMGKPVEGKALLEKTLQELTINCGLQHAETARCLSFLGEVSRMMKQFTEAQNYLTQAEEIQESLVGKDDTRVARTLVFQANLAQDLNEIEQARALLERAYKIFQNTPGMGKKSFFVQQVKQKLASLPKINAPLAENFEEEEEKIQLPKAFQSKNKKTQTSFSWSKLGSQLFQPNADATNLPDDPQQTLQEEESEISNFLDKKDSCTLI